jgi:hypothetical protein
VLGLVTLGVAGCGGAAESDGSARTLRVVTATQVRQLTEAETAGPLFRPDHVSRVGDDLWILDAGNFRIVIRTPDSVYAVGREGDGPGEFRLPLSLSPNVTGGATVWDRIAQRLTRFRPDADVEETIAVEQRPGRLAREVLDLGDRRLVISGVAHDAMNPPAEDDAPPTAIELEHFDSDAIDTVRHVPPWGPVGVWSGDGGSVRLSAFSRPFDSPPHADVSAACGGLAAVSVGGRRLEIVLLDRLGDVVGEIRDSLRGPRITEQEADAFFSTFFPETLVEEFDLRNLLPIPERHPAVHDLQFTSDGRVWARLDPEFILIEADRREHSRWRVWTVRMVDDVVEISPPSDVLLPHLFTPNEVSRDTIWGVRINELGIHTIEGFVVEEWTGSGGCTAR